MAYETDEELKAQIKSWFKAYGTPILIGIFLGTVSIGGWQLWQGYKAGRIKDAASLYQQLVDKYKQTSAEQQAEQSAQDVAVKDEVTQNPIIEKIVTKNIVSIAKQLQTDYADTHYSFFAAMLLAKAYSRSKAYAEAIAELQWVLDHNKDSALQPVAELRLAELLWQTDKIDEARVLLSQEPAPAFVSLYNALLGDIELSVNQRTAAKAAYQKALIHATDNPIQMQILQSKIDYLADVEPETVKPEIKTPA